MSIMEDDILKERYELATCRVREVAEELACSDNEYLSADTTDFFSSAAGCLGRLLDNGNGCDNAYLDSSYAVKVLGPEHGRILSWLIYELHSLEPFVQACCTYEIVIRLELFLEVYAAYTYEWRESRNLPEYETIRRIMYWFAFDYADVAAQQYVEELVSGINSGDGLYLNSVSMLYGFVPGVGRFREEECHADHQADIAMILDKTYVSRRLEVFRTAFEKKGSIKVQTGDPEEERFWDIEGFSREQKNFLREYCHQMKKYVAQPA